MTDVLLRQTNDGGDIEAENGLLVMSGDGLETAAYLSLYGGNEDDPGDASGDRKQWWGNVDETEPARTYRSEFGHLSRSLPATSANLRRFEEAAGRDLAWMVSAGVALSVSVACRIPALNRVAVDVVITTVKGPVPLTFG